MLVITIIFVIFKVNKISVIIFGVLFVVIGIFCLGCFGEIHNEEFCDKLWTSKSFSGTEYHAHGNFLIITL